jgi:hypothetical protein
MPYSLQKVRGQVEADIAFDGYPEDGSQQTFKTLICHNSTLFLQGFKQRNLVFGLFEGTQKSVVKLASIFEIDHRLRSVGIGGSKVVSIYL